jgi:hypothetical protein
VEQLILSHTYDEYLVWHKNRVSQCHGMMADGSGSMDAWGTRGGGLELEAAVVGGI